MIEKEKILVCGSRIKNNPEYKKLVFRELDRELKLRKTIGKKYNIDFDVTIIHGNCENSADVFADEWAKENKINVVSFPGSKGNHLTRNVEMVMELSDNDDLIAFWNGYSYGTAQTIAQAIMRHKQVTVIDLFEELK